MRRWIIGIITLLMGVEVVEGQGRYGAGRGGARAGASGPRVNPRGAPPSLIPGGSNPGRVPNPGCGAPFGGRVNRGGGVPGSPVTRFGGPQTRVESGTPFINPWLAWWNANGRRLRLIDRQSSEGPLSGSRGLATGAGGSSRSNLLGQRRTKAVPSLLNALADSDEPVVIQALMSLARMASAKDADLVVRGLVTCLRHESQEVKHTALFALGQVGGETARNLLRQVIAEHDVARRRLDVEALSLEARAIAATALCWIAETEDIGRLVSFFEQLPAQRTDLQECLIRGLGVLPSHDAEIVPWLVEVLHDNTRDRHVRAAVPPTLAQLTADGADAHRFVALTAMTRLSSKELPASIVRGLALGSAALGTLANQRLVDALRDGLKDEPFMTRAYSLIALGELGANPRVAPQIHRDVRAEICDEFVRKLALGIQKDEAPWIALALGLQFQPLTPDDERNWRRSQRILSRGFRRSAPESRGAFAIALGLIHDAESAELIMEKYLRHAQESDYQLALVGALGLLDNVQGDPRVLKSLGSRRTSPAVRMAASEFLGRTIRDLPLSEFGQWEVQAVTEKGLSQEHVQSVILSRGLLGDDPMAAWLDQTLHDEDLTASARSSAAQALGYYCLDDPYKARVRWQRYTSGWTENPWISWINALL